MTLLNKQKAAEAGLEQAEAQYRDTVIKAFRNVADTLRALQSDARAVKEDSRRGRRREKYLDKIRAQLRFGGVSQLAVVDAQRSLLNASIALVQGEAQRLTDTVRIVRRSRRRLAKLRKSDAFFVRMRFAREIGASRRGRNGSGANGGSGAYLPIRERHEEG